MESPTHSRRVLALDGASVSVSEWTAVSPQGPPMLLLHGGGADSAELSWGELGPALAAAGFRVIAPDHPGFGQSPRAQWKLTQQRLVNYVGELIDALELDEYVIGGLSLGGGLTLGHLLTRPAKARAALLFGSFGIMPRLVDGFWGPLAHFSTFLMLRSGLLGALTRSYTKNPSAMERGLSEIVRSSQARTPELVERVVRESSSGTSLAAFAEWQGDQVRWNRLRTDYTDQLSSIRIPTLLVHGDRDTGVPLARARAAAELLPHAELLTVADAGHWVQRDAPETVTAAVTDFLRRIAPHRDQ